MKRLNEALPKESSGPPPHPAPMSVQVTWEGGWGGDGVGRDQRTTAATSLPACLPAELRYEGCGPRWLLQLSPFQETSVMTTWQCMIKAELSWPISAKGPSLSYNRFSGYLGTGTHPQPPILSDPLYTHLHWKRSLASSRKRTRKNKHTNRLK